MPLFQSKSKKAVGENIETEMDAGKPQKQSIAIALNIQRKNKKKKMAYGGKAEATNEPSMPQPKKDDMRPPKDEYMAGHFAKGGKIKEEDNPMHAEEMTDREMENAEAQRPYDYYNYPREGDPSNPNEDPENLAHGSYAYGGEAEAAGEPPVPKRKMDDKRFPEDEYMSTDKWSKGSPPARKPDDERPPEDEYMADHFAEGGEAEGHYDSVSSAIMAKKRRAKMMAEGGMVDLNENAEEEPNNLDDLNYEALKKENYSEDVGLSQMGSPEDSNEKAVKPPGEDSHDMEDEFRKDVDYSERPADDTDMLNSIMRKMRAKRG